MAFNEGVSLINVVWAKKPGKENKKMKFSGNVNGVSKLIKYGIPILGLMFGGPLVCIVCCILVSCVNVSEKTNEE